MAGLEGMEVRQRDAGLEDRDIEKERKTGFAFRGQGSFLPTSRHRQWFRGTVVGPGVEDLGVEDLGASNWLVVDKQISRVWGDLFSSLPFAHSVYVDERSFSLGACQIFLQKADEKGMPMEA